MTNGLASLSLRGVVVLAAALALHCTPHFRFAPHPAAQAQARDAGCRLDLYTARPTRDFVEVGVLEAVDGTHFSRPAALLAAVRTQVCRAGGDALLAEADAHGLYSRGTVLRYQRAPAQAADGATPLEEGAAQGAASP